ncbi:hypothetical protein L873DRAFT_1817940 [Choiromyces venosus 120613-1]|uniref:Uncharacterized protein n=1 Tax=Choiromyces venosus 120613-1 TaxID=1336337 RepID=A0A3N4J2A7_9PEZI|nr:hypothetical protein L873DRAFT_1817940 [Choiromyces venosus 120613-1]
MVYDIATNKEMKAHIERTVTASEQRTGDKLENLKLEMENLKLLTKSELDNLRLAMELAIRK